MCVTRGTRRMINNLMVTMVKEVFNSLTATTLFEEFYPLREFIKANQLGSFEFKHKVLILYRNLITEIKKTIHNYCKKLCYKELKPRMMKLELISRSSKQILILNKIHHKGTKRVVYNLSKLLRILDKVYLFKLYKKQALSKSLMCP